MSVSVCLSVTEVHWRFIANLGLNSDPILPRIAAAVLCCARRAAVLLACAVLLAGGSSRAILAIARSLVVIVRHIPVNSQSFITGIHA